MSAQRDASAGALGVAFDGDDVVHVTHELVRIPSVSRAEGVAARWFVDALGARGFRSHIDHVGNAVATIGDGPITIALVGHIDTVPGDLDVRLENGVLTGRGTVDAKGPLVTLAAAAHRAAQRTAGRARFLVVGCVEEEVASSKGAHGLLEQASALAAPPAALVIGEPSHWDGVTLGYKGNLRADVTLERESAHGAHEAESAPEAACEAWRRVESAARGFGRDDPGIELSLFDRLMARLLRIDCDHDGAVDRAKLALSLRLPEELPPIEAERWLAGLVEPLGGQITCLGGVEAWRGPRTSPLARALGRAILRDGGKPRFQVKTGTADLNVLAPAWGCPAVAYGPGDAALDHTPHEHVAIAELIRAPSVLTEALVELVATLEPVRGSVHGEEACSTS